jgi:hypothetical protein
MVRQDDLLMASQSFNAINASRSFFPATLDYAAFPDDFEGSLFGGSTSDRMYESDSMESNDEEGKFGEDKMHDEGYDISRSVRSSSVYNPPLLRDSSRDRAINIFDYGPNTVRFPANERNATVVSGGDRMDMINRSHKRLGRPLSPPRAPQWELWRRPIEQPLLSHTHVAQPEGVKESKGDRIFSNSDAVPVSAPRQTRPAQRYLPNEWAEEEWTGTRKDPGVDYQSRLAYDAQQLTTLADTQSRASAMAHYVAPSIGMEGNQHWKHINTAEQKQISETRLLANALRLERKANTDDRCLANAFRCL